MAIYLYIVRHGEAEPVLADDASRELTNHGRQEAQKTAIWLKKQVTEFDLVLASPFVRAQQTKDEIAEHINFKEQLVSEAIIPSGDAAAVADEILARIDNLDQVDADILCVSHMPLVSYLIGELAGYTPIMATAGVAKIKVELTKWRGQLETLIAPEQML